MKNFKNFLRRVSMLGIATAIFLTHIVTVSATDTNDQSDIPEDVSAIEAEYVLLYEANSGTVLYEKNGYEQMRPASTTKIMTAIVVIENTNPEDIVTIGNSVYSLGSTLGLHPGEELTVRDLLHGLMLVSGNDAARALAEHVSGTQSDFVDLMNQYADKLGMTKTHFVNPHGVDKDEHHTSAYDMAILSSYAMQNEIFRDIVSTTTYRIEPTNKNSGGYDLENTNRLIHSKEGDTESFLYEYATGIKTGDTDLAGRCLVASAEKDEMELIALVFGDHENSSIGRTRFIYARSLFDYGFDSFTLLKGSDLDLVSTTTCSISDAVFTQIALNIDLENSYLCVPNDSLQEIRENAPLFGMNIIPKNGELTAPITEGDVVGRVEYVYENNTVFSADLIASQTVETLENSDSFAGIRVDEDNDELIEDNAWLFWVLVASLIILIVIIIMLVSKRRATQLRRRHKRYRFRYK